MSRLRSQVALLGLLALFSVLGALAAGCGAGAGAGRPDAVQCGARLVEDWTSDGRIDGLYAGHCYQDALAALPEDVRTYSSAVDDITRAMQSREAGARNTRPVTPRQLTGEEATALAARPAATRRVLPVPVAVIAALAAAVAAATSIAFGVRRARRAR